MGSTAAMSVQLYETNVLQHPQELSAFIDLLNRENVRSYLEIGSKFGGSLWKVASCCDLRRVVSVDLPNGTRKWSETEKSLLDCVTMLRYEGRDAHLFFGDSTSRDIVQVVTKLGPFDAVLIDANHTLPYVRADWENYGPMARIVAFHDISWKRPEEWHGGYRIDVPQFWDSIKGGYCHEEIRLDPTGQDNGFGVLWRN